MAKNIGEFDEMKAKLHLIELRDAGKSITINGKQVRVFSVGNGGIECKPLPIGTDLSQLTDFQIEKLAKRLGAFKAPTGSKADVYLNGLGISVKSHRGANPAFLNHTHRAGLLKVCKRVGSDIKQLDKIIKEYWKKRNAGIIGEDVKNSDPNSPFRKHLTYLKPILNYFLFKGSAQKDSDSPADFILDFTDPLNEKGWKFSKEDYIEDNWDFFVFSLRSKGIPDTFPNCKDAKLIETWVQLSNGKLKGTLHGRVRF